MGMIHEHHRDQSIPNVNPTQFALVPIGRVIFLIERYEAMKVDATTPPSAPLAYIERTLCELRRELLSREGEGVAA